MKKNKLLLILLVASILTNLSCHKRIEDEMDYAKYDRIVGPEGKKLIFFRNYGDDTDFSDTLIVLDIPAGALDTTVIFNYYTFFNDVVYNEIGEEFDLDLLSEFFYFLPFFNEYSNVEDIEEENGDYQFDRHLSLIFIDSYSRLFKIKIPENDEWGVNYNIYTKFNQQLYPTGFDETDLALLINGKWNEFDDYGSGAYSMINWTELSNFTFDEDRNTLTFDIMDTDGMYVVAEDW